MSAKKKRRVEWKAPLVASSVEAHPDLLTIPTFVLFVQKDELAMSRADAHKEERKASRQEFEEWLIKQTEPRAPAPNL